MPLASLAFLATRLGDGDGAGSAEGLREGIASPAKGLVATEDVALTAAYMHVPLVLRSKKSKYFHIVEDGHQTNSRGIYMISLFQDFLHWR